MTIKREFVESRGMLKLAIHNGLFHLPLERVMPLDFSPKYVPRKRRLTPELARLGLAELPDERRGWFAFTLATGGRKSEVERALLADIGESEVFMRGTKTEASEDTVPITTIQRPWIAIAKKYAKKTGPAFGTWPNVRRGLRHACDRLSTCAKCRAGERADGRARGTPDPDCDGCKKMPKVPPGQP